MVVVCAGSLTIAFDPTSGQSSYLNFENFFMKLFGTLSSGGSRWGGGGGGRVGGSGTLSSGGSRGWGVGGSEPPPSPLSSGI